MSSEPPQLASDGVMADVLAQGRAACYKARDAFFACLEKESDKKPTEIATVGLLYPAQCKSARAEFASKCRPTWVKHFDRQYCAKKRVQRLLDDGNDPRRGPISLPQPYTFKP
ncbi:uncharacterized protein LOC103980301 [Musa acuminata AAA Group]|uniref:Cytochrome c oxidase assembly factor 6 n=1 Tax=Musa acuminata subsp. malaccensis TaxID=214687 RepID=A0A804IK12_MUSAM|nr:PREDICTED: uncharacterized protein LOC103980301 [Musa acuminata subsp. malaccensis]